jgi:hypothetical protein
MNKHKVLPKDKMTPKERFFGICLTVLFIIYFTVFMLPESVLNNFSADILCTKIYPEFFWNAIENNIIKPTIFPAAAYVFWVIFPFAAISTFVYFSAAMWPVRRLEIYISRRKDEKTMYVCSLFILVTTIGSLFISNPSSPMALFIKPFQNKLFFFLLYGGGALIFPLSLVLIVANIRARLHLNRR